MPGIATEDIDIQVDEDVLTLRGEKKEQKKREGENVHHVERRYGSFLRQIRLPNAVDAERTVATMNHGVLTLELPKVAPKTGRKIAVKPGA
jgi:HSP20 family protein